MIRYKAAGVTATLVTADLHASLSRSVTLTMGKEQAVDDKRVDELLAAGQKLESRPIGADGSEHGVLQFLGDDNDVPFMMAEAGQRADTLPQPQALRLVLDTNEQAHSGKRKTTETDLKIEVFLNGELCDSLFLNPKKTGLVNQYKLSGTRIQRQIEKPFTYQSPTGLQASSMNAEQRWSRTSTSFAGEASLRGADKWGDRSPTGNFCAALAKVPLPLRLLEKSHLGIIDIIVVSGKGGKDGASEGYIGRPTRLRSDEYSSTALPVPAQLNPPVMGRLFDTAEQQLLPGHEDLSLLRHDSVVAESLSRPPTSSAATRQTRVFVATIAEGDDPFAESAIRGGQPSSSSSSDIRWAMDSQSKTKLKLKLKAERKLTPAEKTASEFAKDYGIPYDPDAKVDSFKDRRGKEGGARMVTHRIADIRKMTPNHRNEAVRTLRDDIERRSSSKQNSPGRSDRGLVKLPLKRESSVQMPSPAAVHSPTVTPRRRPRSGTSSGIVQTPAQSTPAVTTPARRASHKRGKLDDQTPEEALENFRLPGMCQGSVLSYADGNASRQIPKTRPGYFDEDEFIVGMRFVVG